MNGKYKDRIESYHIIDCRYSYEYNGGHIQGAENISCPLMIQKRFFDVLPCLESAYKHILVFHCEHSMQRAPRMYHT